MKRASNVHIHPTALAADRAQSPEPGRVPLVRMAAPLPSRSECLVDIRLTEELETIRRYVEMASAQLGSDAVISHRHPSLVKDLKQAGAVLGQLATVIGAADKEGAIDRIAVPELKARLRRKPIRTPFESAH